MWPREVLEMKKLYKNGYLYVEDIDGNFEFVYGWLLTDGERISEIAFGDFDGDCDAFDEVVDLKGGGIAPGLIDMHSHGRAGGDFNSADTDMMKKMSRSYLESGVTSVMPTLASDTLEGFHRSIESIALAKREGAENFIGVHLEGRYLNEKRRGAHSVSLLAPLDADEIETIITEMKKVGIVMGSASDLPIVKKAIDTLEKLQDILDSELDGWDKIYKTYI